MKRKHEELLVDIAGFMLDIGFVAVVLFIACLPGILWLYPNCFVWGSIIFVFEVGILIWILYFKILGGHNE